MEHRRAFLIDRLVRKNSRDRGCNSENRARESLNLLQEQGKIITYWDSSREQNIHEGIDFYVQGADGSEIPLQIKSSAIGARTHKRKFPDVPCLVVSPLDTEAKIRDKILSLLKANQPCFGKV